MAEAVVSIVIEGIKPLGDLIVREAKILSGVGYQVELAQVELHLMGAFLKDADSKAGDDEVVRIWVKLIRDVAYDLEDVIESFALKVAFRRRGSLIKLALKRFACIFSEGVGRHRIGSEIEDIMSKLSSLRSSLQSYNIRQSDPERVTASNFQKLRDRRLTYAHEVESHIVGLEKSTNTLVKELMREGKRHRVVSIWGMGGSGKTTLAKQVFLQNEVQRHFDCFAWVCISQQCEGRGVLEEILTKLTSPTEKQKEKIAKMKKDEIAEKLCSIQREKKCLVILDDIWTHEAWHSLKAGFPVDGETESRILLTTRKKEVALLANRDENFLHEPQPLNDMQSWKLFEKIALSGSHHTDLEKKTELGKQMLAHCSRFPLAIRVLAGLLSRRETTNEWEMVLRNVNAYIMRGTNVFERENTGQKYGVSGVLALSYDDLPSQLKLCFLYLAQYPEDHEIPVKRLTQLWMAEGFIISTSEIRGSMEIMEDVAYGCLIELVERSMVQVAKYGLGGKVKTCRLHDLMRDLCLQKAKEENFLTVINFSEGLKSNTRPIGKARRLAMYLGKYAKYEFNSGDGRDDRIRSLLYFTPEGYYRGQNKKFTCSVFNDFKLLRVLKFENINRDFNLPKTIGKLVHLRFLSLKNSAFGELPSSVSNLVLLQTLDLRSSLYLKSSWFSERSRYAIIRNVFWNMEQLRHLYLPTEGGAGKENLSLARLHNLQTLVNISLSRCDFDDFVRLKKLNIFFPRGGEELEKLKNVLTSASVTCDHLQSLSITKDKYGRGDIAKDIVLRCPHIYKLKLNGRITDLPEELLEYPNLTKISLTWTKLKADRIEFLAKLPHLRVLHLSEGAFESNLSVFSHGGFPQLEVLVLSELYGLKEWKVEKGALPCLQRLKIEDCYELGALPNGLQDITTLMELTIKSMPSRFCSRVVEGGDDFYKIKHVPSVIIANIDGSEEDEEAEMEEAASSIYESAGPDDIFN